MKRRRPRPLLRREWPRDCENCGASLYCPNCGAWQPVRHWTQEEIDAIRASDEFGEFFGPDGIMVR